MKKYLSYIITIIIAFILYYFMLPPINLHSFSFYFYIIIVLVIFMIINGIINSEREMMELLFNKRKVVKLNNSYKIYKICISIILIIFGGTILVNFISSPIFNAKSYHNRIKIDESGDFSKDVAEVDFNALPLLDRESSEVLGDRVMGQMSEWVSQFDVSDMYTQINYKGSIVRVTPLTYADSIKWLTNRSEGIKGYIIVNSVTGKTELVKLNKGMKYVPSALLNDNMERRLRFKYPTTLFTNTSFEIDEEGNPYYIITTIDYTAVGLKEKVTGVIIYNPITGESKKYKKENIPRWVDIAYSASLVIEQVDDWGTYNKGFLNSIFGQKNVVNTTDGYNYLAMDDDIYLYTGITSVVSDESNLGFILSNMRTGETKYYKVAGAEEYSAMNSAEGQVQDMGYKSTFPLLINLKGKPTYLVSLKDSNGLVKMYGFIDVVDYQKVSVTDSSKGIITAKDNYLKMTKAEAKDEELERKKIIVEAIHTAIINGNTYYYIESKEGKFKISINMNENLPFLKVGDTIDIGYYETGQKVIEIEKMY